MIILKKLLLISVLSVSAGTVCAQSTINVFTMIMDRLTAVGFADELESGDFKAIWGQSITEMGVEIAKLNLQFYETKDDKARVEQIMAYLGGIDVPALGYIFLPEINAISVIAHETGTNRAAIYGGYVVLAYFIAFGYSYDQYCQIYKLDNALRLPEFLTALRKIIRQNWLCGTNSPEYRELAAFVRTYGSLDTMSAANKQNGIVRYSLDDYFQTNFMTLILYIYTHELSHIVLKHDPGKSMAVKEANEIDADMWSAMYLFTRIRGGWGVETGNGKITARIEPVLRMFEFIIDLEPGKIEKRVTNFMRHYLWTESFYDNAQDG